MPPLPRRLLLLGAAASALPPRARAATLPASGRLAFAVTREGSRIGHHILTLERQGDTLSVRIDVRLQVKFGPITVFRYSHQGTERWNEAGFVSLETETDNDGEPLRVAARRDADAVRVSGKSGQQRYPAGALPLTHWNIACMRAPTLFNPQDGERMQLAVSPGGDSTIGGQPARRFLLTGESELQDFYGATDQWVALRAKAKDGSMIHYDRAEA